jgi:hypothetical protein
VKSVKDCSQTIEVLIKKATGRKVAFLPTEELTVALNLTREELLSEALEIKLSIKDQIGL